MLKQTIIDASKACALVFRSAILILFRCLWYVAFQVAKFCLILLLAVGIAYSLFYFAERARGQPIAHHRFELRTGARRENAIKNVEEIGDMETNYRTEDAQGGYFTMLKRATPEKETRGPTKDRSEQKLDSAPSGKAKPAPATGKTYEVQPMKDESKVSEKFRKQDEAIAIERAIPAPIRTRGIETKGEVAHKTEHRAELKGDLEQTGPTTSEKSCWAKMVGFCCGFKTKIEQEKEPRKSKKPDEAITVENIKKRSETAAPEALKPTYATKEINKPKTPEMPPPVDRKHDEGIGRTEEIRERIRKREQYEPQSAEHHTSRTLRRSIQANKMNDDVDRLVYMPKDIRKSADARLERYFSDVYLKGMPKVRRVASDTWHPLAPSIGVPVSQTTKSPRKGTSPLQNQSPPYVMDANGVGRSMSSAEKKKIIIPSSKRPREDRPPLKRSERVEESEANEIDESMSTSAPASTLTPKSPREDASHVVHDKMPESRKMIIRQSPLEDREPIRRRKLVDEFESDNIEKSSSSPIQSFPKGTPKVHLVASDTWDSRSRPLPTKTHENQARSPSASKESVNGRNLGETSRVAARKSEGTRPKKRSSSPGTSKKQLLPPRRKTA